jgi:hypothetical protein
MQAIPYGDPTDPGTLQGPRVSARQRDRVLSYIRKGVEEGANLVVGGHRPAHLDKGYFVEPTLFTDVDNSMTIAQEEIAAGQASGEIRGDLSVDAIISWLAGQVYVMLRLGHDDVSARTWVRTGWRPGRESARRFVDRAAQALRCALDGGGLLVQVGACRCAPDRRHHRLGRRAPERDHQRARIGPITNWPVSALCSGRPAAVFPVFSYRGGRYRPAVTGGVQPMPPAAGRPIRLRPGLIRRPSSACAAARPGPPGGH